MIIMQDGNERKIIPYRVLPFDIGRTLDENDKIRIKNALSEFEEEPLNPLLAVLSKELMLQFDINEGIRLYIYRFGIGVFYIKDESFISSDDRYAVTYCESRKNAHKAFFDFTHRDSALLSRIMELTRNSARANKDQNLRISSQNDWEQHGISYVMTISFIKKKKRSYNPEVLDENEMKNLIILLDPSLAQQEDSLYINLQSIRNDAYDFEITDVMKPKSWIKSKDLGIYISWAAVIVVSDNFASDIVEFFEALEVDLQALWMYTYCLYTDLKTNQNKRIKISNLKRKAYKYKMLYTHFEAIDDTSMPTYLAAIREELIRTSGIREQAQKYENYLQYLIEDIKTEAEEKQRRYSWVNEILLFLIAFIQIAPMLYDFLCGNGAELKMGPVFIMVLFVMICIVIIIRKDDW